MHKKIMIMAAVLMIVVVAFTPVFAINMNFPTGSGNGGKVATSAKKVWATITTVVQIAAFAAVVFAGVRYMFASADQKADIKKGLGMLALGAMLVFAASTVVKFIVNAGTEIIGNSSGGVTL